MPSIRPSRAGYWIAAILVVVAVAAGILAGVSFSAFDRQVDSFQRVQAPGQSVLTFSRPGGYLIYFEAPGFSGLWSTGTVRLSIVSQASGQPVPISSLGGQQETYSVGGHSGQAVASFTIASPGKYVLNAGTPTNPALADIAVGPGIGTILAEAGAGVVICILAFIGAVALTIVFRVLRGRARRRLYAAGRPLMAPGIPGMPYGGPGPPQPYGQYPGAGPAPGTAAPPQPYGQYPGAAPGSPQPPVF